MKMSMEDVAEVTKWAAAYMDKLTAEEREKMQVILDLYSWLMTKAAEAMEGEK